MYAKCLECGCPQELKEKKFAGKKCIYCMRPALIGISQTSFIKEKELDLELADRIAREL